MYSTHTHINLRKAVGLHTKAMYRKLLEGNRDELEEQIRGIIIILEDAETS